MHRCIVDAIIAPRFRIALMTLPYFSCIALLGVAGGTLFLTVLAGGATVWFRRMRAGANVDGNADGDRVHGGVQPAGVRRGGEADASL
ncbi:MAG: hypothetical protein GY845_25365 [Planctomycetes bacterium]|nr:hypothetical protein [Planctomycetota bacterium]